MYLPIYMPILFIAITPSVISKVHSNKKNIYHQDNNNNNNNKNDEESNRMNINNNNLLSPLSSSSDNDYFNIKSLINKNKLNKVDYQGDVNKLSMVYDEDDNYDDDDFIIYKSSLQCAQFRVSSYKDEEENNKIVMNNFDIIYLNDNNDNNNNNNHIDGSTEDKSAKMNLYNNSNNNNNKINNNNKYVKENKRIRYKGNTSATCKFRNSNSGCFAVWQNNTNNNSNNVNNNKNFMRSKSSGFLLKSERNCWDGQDEDNFNCINQDKCVAQSAGNGIYYCCCDKAMCNVEMILSQTISQSTNRGTALHNKKSALFYAALYSLVPLSIVTIIIILGFFVYRMCVSKEDTSPSTSTTLKSAKTTPLLPPPSPTLSLHTSSLATVSNAHPASLLTAEILKKIELLEIKAERFFGCVRRGKLNDEIVAVKIFNAQEKKSWEAERNFYNQPFMLSTTRSPHVLKFITAYKQEQQLLNNNNNNNNNNNDNNNNMGSSLPHYWLITEYHDLGSLYDFLKHHSNTNQPLILPTALNLIRTMCLGLNFLHSRNHSHVRHASMAIDRWNKKSPVAHRDIKSRNILVKGDLSCCVADFGLALVMDGRDLSNQSQVGTVRYMSPEWLACESEFKEKCFLSNDVYALGLVIWEVLSMVKEGDIEPTDRYRLPYEERVGSNPSIEEMHQLVTVKKYRPFLNPQWTQHKTLEVMRDKLEKMWDEDYEARISVSNVLNSLDRLTEEVEETNNNNNNNNGTGCSFDNDSFIINNNNHNNILNTNNNILIHVDNNPNKNINNNSINNNSINITNNNNSPNNNYNNNMNNNNNINNNNNNNNKNLTTLNDGNRATSTLATPTTIVTTSHLPTTSLTTGFSELVATDSGASFAAVIPVAVRLATHNLALSDFKVNSVTSATPTSTTITTLAKAATTQTTSLLTAKTTAAPAKITKTTTTPLTTTTQTTTTPFTTTSPTITTTQTSPTTPVTTTTKSDLDHTIIAPSILTFDIDDDYLVPPFNLIKMATPLPPPISNTIDNGGEKVGDDNDGITNSCINNNNNNDDDGGGDGRLERRGLMNTDSNNIENINNMNNKTNLNNKNNNNAIIFNFESCMNERQRLEIDHFQNKYNDNKIIIDTNNKNKY